MIILSVICPQPYCRTGVSLHAPYIMDVVWFAESLDKLGDNLTEVHPTVFVGVPRVWEKIQAKMMIAGAANPPLKKKIAAWARKKGLEGGYAFQKGESLPFLHGLANKLVFSKVREKMAWTGAKFCFYSRAHFHGYVRVL
ncbi:MAG: hypothetical protein R2874_07670 [Desulfobacterales bacterium]